MSLPHLPSLPDSLSLTPANSSSSTLETLLHHLFRLAYQAGAFGLFCVGVLDSSFLFVPLGNDFLMLGLSARHHDRVPYYVIAATIGSVCGIFLTFWVSEKKGGEKRNKRGRTWKYVESQMKKNAGWSLTVGSLMPPPFPFTLFVAAAGDLRVPLYRKCCLTWPPAASPFPTIEGVLAIVYGRWIFSLARSPPQYHDDRYDRHRHVARQRSTPSSPGSAAEKAFRRPSISKTPLACCVICSGKPTLAFIMEGR